MHQGPAQGDPQRDQPAGHLHRCQCLGFAGFDRHKIEESNGQDDQGKEQPDDQALHGKPRRRLPIGLIGFHEVCSP